MSTVRIQVRRGTASQWTSVNPILAAGEMGVESDTNLFKFGNGTSTWTALAYANNSDVAIAEISQDAINNALSLGEGLTKTYNDGANTITIAVDSDVIALTSYVDTAVSNLSNTSDATYLLQEDRGAAFGVASLDADGKVPNSQIDSDTFATKLHVSSVASGLQIKSAVKAASTENFASTRSAGSADASGGNGVGETLTASSNGALVIDGVSISANDRVLIKNQTDATQNGIYIVTNAGGASAAAVLTRATDADNSVDGEVREGLFAFVQNGTENQRDGFVLLAEASRAGEIFQLGTDSLNFSQFTGAIPVNIGNGLVKTNDQIAVDFNEVASATGLTSTNTQLSGYITSNDANIQSLNTTTSNTNAGLDAAVDRIEAVELYGPRLTTAEADILAIEAVNVSQDADIAAAVAVNGTQQSEIDALETLTTAQGVTIDSHTSTLATHTTDIADLVTQDATHTSDIAAANSAISSINTNLAPKESPTFTGTVVLPSTTSIGDVSSDEIGYVNGVTSGIQAQIDTKLATSTAESTYETISNVALKAPLADPTFTGTVSGVTKAHVGLGDVDNTSDSDKPVSTAQAAAIATAKSEAVAEVTAVIDGAPNALDTLNELAAALGDDANFASTVTTSLAGKVASYTPVTSKTANFGINDADYHDGWLDLDSTDDITITVPADGTNSITYPIGTSFDIFRVNTGQVIISGSGATVNGTPGLKLRARYSSATLFKRAENTWVLIGDLTA